MNKYEKVMTEVMENIGYDDCYMDKKEIAFHIPWGDWKHSHLYCDYIMRENGFILADEEITEEDGSDCYSAWRIYREGKLS